MDLISELPGLYDVPELDYHADAVLAPELGHAFSYSGAKLILDSPARYHWRRDAGEEHRDIYDFGHAVHGLILGNGRPLRVVDAYDWKRPRDQQAKRDAYAAGEVPLHRGEFRTAARTARAVHRHELAGAILSEGQPEQSFYWRDPATGVTLRGRADWLRVGSERGDVIADVKTVHDASPGGFARLAANMRWYMQAPWYQDGVEAVLGLRLPFVFIAVEKEPPHFVGVYQLDQDAMALGRSRNRQAIDTFAECESADEWPSWSSEIETVSLPRFAYYTD